LAAAVAAEEGDTRKSPGRKDKDWCKPNRGPHTPKLEVVTWLHALRSGGGCQWSLTWDVASRDLKVGWRCFHEEVCSGCGKKLRIVVQQVECPHWREATPAERQALDAQLADARAKRAERARSQPATNGRTSYRRKRSGGPDR
jgi:predicted Fe-S protein YdhL (DUF1289 family)